MNEIDITNSNIEVTDPNFIGEYCGEYAKKYNRCWCYKSDWDNDLFEIETPKGPIKSLIIHEN